MYTERELDILFKVWSNDGTQLCFDAWLEQLNKFEAQDLIAKG